MAEGTEFIYADKVEGPFQGMRAEGVLGLGPRPRKVRDFSSTSDARKDPDPLVSHLYKKKAISKNMFSVIL